MSATKIVTSEAEIPSTSTIDGSPSTMTIATSADALIEYVVAGTNFWYQKGARILPFTIDDLTDNFGDGTYEKMLWDPLVRAAHVVYKKSVLAQGLRIIPAKMDDEGRQKQADAIAARCQRNLEEIGIADRLNNMLDSAAFGNKIAEKVWEYRETGPDKGKYMLKSLKVKARRCVAFVCDPFLNVVGILAISPGTGMPINVGSIFTQANVDYGVRKDSAFDPDKVHILPLEKFFVLTHEPVDSDPRGTSHLRPAYSAWWGKQQLTPEYLRYLGQWGTPSLVGYTAPGASSVKDVTTGKTISAQQAMVNSLVAFRSGSAAAFPAGSKVEVLMAHMNPRSFTEDFAHFNREITIGILHQELATGSGAKDSRAAAQVHQDVLGTIIRHGKKPVERGVERDLLTDMVLYNEGESARDMIPTASLGETNEVDQATLMASYAQMGYELSPSQFPGIDQALNMPIRSTEELKALSDRATAPLPDPNIIDGTARATPPKIGAGGTTATGRPKPSVRDNNAKAGK